MSRMDAFCLESIRFTLAEMCDDRGFHSIEPGALAVLTQVLMDYLRELSFRAHHTSELAGHRETHLLDVRRELATLGMDRLRLLQYHHADQTRFPLSAPSATVLPAETAADTVACIPYDDAVAGGTSVPDQPLGIPGFLPALPARHTYLPAMVSDAEATAEASVGRIRAERRRQVQNTLVRLFKPTQVPTHVAQNPFLLSGRTRQEWDMQAQLYAATAGGKVSEAAMTRGYVQFRVGEIYEEERRMRQKRPRPQDETSDKKRKRMRGNLILGMAHRDGLEVPSTASVG